MRNIKLTLCKISPSHQTGILGEFPMYLYVLYYHINQIKSQLDDKIFDPVVFRMFLVYFYFLNCIDHLH